MDYNRYLIESYLLVLKRICIRGRNLGLSKDDNEIIDMFQHMEDELNYLCLEILNKRINDITGD
jgi:hypothetical protein